MKRIEFEVQTVNILDEIELVPVTGYEVTIPGFETFKFAAHNKKDFYDDKNGWCVSELSSGCAVVQSRRTRKKAIEEASHILKSKSTPDDLQKIIDSRIRTLCIS